ncbi:hypothetical protein BH10ACT3_BH10ACT3_01320 [soil metagenome]
MSITPSSRAAEALDALVRPAARQRFFQRNREPAGPRSAPASSASTDRAAGDGRTSGDDDGAFSEFGLGQAPVRSRRPAREQSGRRLPFSLPSVRSRLDRRVLVGLGLAAVAMVVISVGWKSVSRPASLEESMPIAGDEPAADPAAAAAGGAATATTVAPGSTGVGGATTTVAGGSVPSGGAVDPAAPVFVPVAGAVAAPGVVQLPGGSRVVDAVAAAGGLRSDADPDRVNLAAPLIDGSRIVVPAIGQDPPAEVPVEGAAPATGTGSSGATGATLTPSAPVDLNTATIEQLDELPGVGPATAQAIVSFRESEGRFTSVDALLDVRGIGDAKLEALRDLVTVG